MTLERLILHWTGGAGKASAKDRKAYHFIVEADGDVVRGDHFPEDNLSTKDGDYAAHTQNCNTGSIGVAMAGMHGAREKPFTVGQHPLTRGQVDEMVRLCAQLCMAYDIPVTRETVLTHAEVQPTLRIAQKQKWDITWLPGMDKPGDPIAVGDRLRLRIKDALTARAIATPPQKPAGRPVAPVAVSAGPNPVPAATGQRRGWAWLRRWFGK